MKTTYNRDASDNAIVLRGLVRKTFEPSPCGDEMILLVEEWDDPNLKVSLWVQFVPRLQALPNGGCKCDFGAPVLFPGNAKARPVGLGSISQFSESPPRLR